MVVSVDPGAGRYMDQAKQLCDTCAAGQLQFRRAL